MLNRLFFTSLTVVIALAGCGRSGTDTEERLALLARDILHRQEVVTPEELSDWIIQERQDFVLLDVRSQKAFQAGHIQGARSVPLTYLLERGSIEKLPQNRLLVLYSDVTRKAAEATAALRITGRHVSFLEGGYESWRDRILQPQQVPGEGDDEVRKKIAVACYFAGNYKKDAGKGFVPPIKPMSPAALSSSAVEKAQRKRRKKRKAIQEGC